MEMKYLIRAWALLALLPIINAFSIVITYGANRPHIEEFFSTALVAIAAHDGTLTLSQLLEPVNEHPQFFTKLILALHTNLTRFDLRVDMFLSVVMNTAIFLVLFWWLWKQDRRLALVVAPFLSLLVLTPAQANNWLVAFQNIFFISVLFLVLILSVISYLPIGWRAMVYAMILALAGSFSMGIAPAMWAAPLLTLWLRGYRNWSYYAVWFVLGGIIVGYSILTTKPLFPTLSLRQLDIFISFTFAYLGNFLFANNSNLSIVFGISGLLLLAVNAFLLWLKNPRWLAGWAGILSFSVISALMTSYGRGILMTVASNSPLQSRYVTHSVLMWVALLAISSCNALLWRQAIPKRRRVSLKLPAAILIFKTRSLICSISFFSLATCILVILCAILASSALNVMDARDSLACLLEFPTTRSDCIKAIAANPDQVTVMAVRLDQLAARQLGPFANRQPVQVSDQKFSIRLEELGAFAGDAYMEFRKERINSQLRPVFYQHPPRSFNWLVWFQHVHVPAYFESEIYVLPTENPDNLPIDGVTFRVYAQVQSENERTLLFEKHFDPRVHQEPIPIRVSLESFHNRLVRLHIFLETDAGEAGNSYYDWAVWIEPRIVLELSEEAARAVYYPPR